MTPKEAFSYISAPVVFYMHRHEAHMEALDVIAALVNQPRTVAEIRAEVERLKAHYNDDYRRRAYGFDFAQGGDCVCEQLLDFIDGEGK